MTSQPHEAFGESMAFTFGNLFPRCLGCLEQVNFVSRALFVLLCARDVEDFFLACALFLRESMSSCRVKPSVVSPIELVESNKEKVFRFARVFRVDDGEIGERKSLFFGREILILHGVMWMQFIALVDCSPHSFGSRTR
jgi:hypothetical protein